MKKWAQKQTGFTIVELLIVVVVIAILAAVTIVGYNGIRERATVSQVQTALSQANKKILTYAVANGDQFPAQLSDIGIQNTESTAYQYTRSTSGTPRYALTVSNGVAGPVNYYLASNQSTITSGIAPGHNIMPWREPQTDSAPVNLDSYVTIDTSQFRSSPASIRISPWGTGKGLREWRVSGTPGQTVTVVMWVKSAADWNGTSSNSKIRFGTTGGALIKDCGYNGVKLNWTEAKCTLEFTTAIPTTVISIGNDGGVGNIWLDDISVSVE